jgi:uncharacterized protein (TIGR02118 family)
MFYRQKRPVRRLERHMANARQPVIACGKRRRQREETVAKLLVMYKTPSDTAAFDAYYVDTHAPLAKKLPGLRSYDVSRGPVATPAGASGFHLVAILAFDSLGTLQAALASPEGQAAVGDLANFATGGVDVLMFDSRGV